MPRPARPHVEPRPGQVWWNSRLRTNAVLYEVAPGRIRAVLLTVGQMRVLAPRPRRITWRKGIPAVYVLYYEPPAG